MISKIPGEAWPIIGATIGVLSYATYRFYQMSVEPHVKFTRTDKLAWHPDDIRVDDKSGYQPAEGELEDE